METNHTPIDTTFLGNILDMLTTELEAALDVVVRHDAEKRMMEVLDHCSSNLAGRALDLARFETQATNEDQSRPDLIGQTVGGERRLLMEVKFWAGLTDA